MPENKTYPQGENKNVLSIDMLRLTDSHRNSNLGNKVDEIGIYKYIWVGKYVYRVAHNMVLILLRKFNAQISI